jgi:hypothetical protein
MEISTFDITILISFLISLSVYFIKPAPLYLKLLPVYWFCMLVSGLIQEYIMYQHHYNTGVANIWTAIEFCFDFFIIREILVSAKTRKIILYLIIFFALFAAIHLYMNREKIGFDTVNYTVGTIIITVLCICYYIELFQKTADISLARQPAFWIVSGIFFNAVLNFPLFVMETFMEESTHFHTEDSRILFNNIGTIGDIILILTTSLYTIGVLCRIRINRSTL